jgi:hypothetical protein
MLLSKDVELTCIPTNKKQFEKAGLKWEYREVISVPVSVLTEKSHAKVWILCDYCLNSKVFKPFSRYNRDRSEVARDCCSNLECMKLKREEVNITKHGVKNPSHRKEVIKKITDKTRTPLKMVEAAFHAMSYRLITKDYINGNQELYFACTKHEELGEQVATYSSVRQGFVACKKCISENCSERVKGSKNPMWSGGTRSLNTHLREVITEWKRLSWLKCNFKCIVTGNDKQDELTIHHLHSFKEIVKEALKNLGLPWLERTGDYNAEQLSSLEQEVVKLHKKYPLGVVIKKKIHDHYHSIYRDNVNAESFKVFLNDYYSLETKPKSIENYDSTSIRKYYPMKQGKVRFYGVVYVAKQRNKYVATLKRNGKTEYLGSYGTEVEAAYFFNQRIIDARGKKTTINYLTDEEKQFVETKIRNGGYLSSKSSPYKHVTRRGNRWEASFRFNGQNYYVGSFSSDVEAAIEYNKFIAQNKIDKEPIKLRKQS